MKMKRLIKLSYAQFQFQQNNFLLSNRLATEIIMEANSLLRNDNTSDFAWLLIRRSLKLFNDKNIARENLNKLINNIENSL